MPRPPGRPAALLDDEPFLGRWAVDEGLLTVDQLRSSAWQRLFRGVYVDRDVPVTHALRAQAACVLLPAAVVTGRSAAVLWGVQLAGADDDVEVTVPPTSHPHRLPGLRVRRADLAREHRGSYRARRVCALADGLAGSPQETRLRLLMRRSGLPSPAAQHRVIVDGRSVARVDFAWPEQKLALEYDGPWHGEPGQFAKDRRRLNKLTAAGWRVIFVTAADLRDPVALLARIAAALRE